ncbi:hypothetical protein Peur_039996 [Populus x canadensis]
MEFETPFLGSRKNIATTNHKKPPPRVPFKGNPKKSSLLTIGRLPSSVLREFFCCSFWDSWCFLVTNSFQK